MKLRINVDLTPCTWVGVNSVGCFCRLTGYIYIYIYNTSAPVWCRAQMFPYSIKLSSQKDLPIINVIGIHDDVIKWKHFPPYSCYWPFVTRIYRSPVNSLHKGQWHGALIFLSSSPEQTVEQTTETPVIWGAIARINWTSHVTIVTTLVWLNTCSLTKAWIWLIKQVLAKRMNKSEMT